MPFLLESDEKINHTTGEEHEANTVVIAYGSGQDIGMQVGWKRTEPRHYLPVS